MKSGVVIAWLLVATAAHAQPGRVEPAASARKVTRAAAPASKSTPWSEGVSDTAQKRALQLFQDGNTFFEQSKYTDAVARYEQALTFWDHPNIRFNMAVCLINMRQPLVAWTHLQQALRFGDAPLGKHIHAEATNYVAALEASLAELTVTSSQPEVRIMVDGAPVTLTGGKHTMKLLAGKHQLVATRPGYLSESRALDLPAGSPVTEDIALVAGERVSYERRWSWWVPWSAAAGSVVLGIVGTSIYLSARSDIRAYDEDLREACPIGCTAAEIPGELTDRAHAARRNSGIGVGLWVGAGALAITGGTLAVLNRRRRVDDRVTVPTVAVARDYVGVGVAFALE